MAKIEQEQQPIFNLAGIDILAMVYIVDQEWGKYTYHNYVYTYGDDPGQNGSNMLRYQLAYQIMVPDHPYKTKPAISAKDLLLHKMNVLLQRLKAPGKDDRRVAKQYDRWLKGNLKRFIEEHRYLIDKATIKKDTPCNTD